MRTIEISEFGDPSVLKIGERENPAITASQILIKTIASGVNGPDIMQRKGQYPPPPGASDLMGLEVSGEVVAVGTNVTQWKIGDLICALANGGAYAEYVAIEADHCLPIPEGVSAIDAAGLCETYFTVWSNLFLEKETLPKSTLLVHGGSGGIGITAIQLGKQLGMRVFATCSSEAKAKFCEENGATRAINYLEEDFVEVMRAEGGADLILDIVGADYIARNMKAANMDARIVQLAFRKGSQVDINLMPIMLKRLKLTGSTLRPRPKEFKAKVARDLRAKVWPMFATGALKTHTFNTFKFSQAVEAHEMMEAAKHMGKIILVP